MFCDSQYFAVCGLISGGQPSLNLFKVIRFPPAKYLETMGSLPRSKQVDNLSEGGTDWSGKGSGGYIQQVLDMEA